VDNSLVPHNLRSGGDAFEAPAWRAILPENWVAKGRPGSASRLNGIEFINLARAVLGRPAPPRREHICLPGLSPTALRRSSNFRIVLGVHFCPGCCQVEKAWVTPAEARPALIFFPGATVAAFGYVRPLIPAILTVNCLERGVRPCASPSRPCSRLLPTVSAEV